MRSFLIVFITVCVLVLGFGVYWMLAGTGEAPEAEATGQRTRRVATTLPTAGQSVVGPGRKVFIEKYDDDGQLSSKFRAGRYEPQKGGRWHVQDPEAEFYLHNGQVLRLIGEKGTVNIDDAGGADGDLAATQQMPRGGELQNVRLLLLAKPGAQRAIMTLSMKNASFDNETFRISTEAYRDGDVTVPADRVHVKVRGADYEFDGYGLRLQYNELDRRLEYLRITHGERLLIKHPTKFMKGKTLGTKEENERVPQAVSEANGTPAEPVPSVSTLLPTRALADVGLAAADEAAAGEAAKRSSLRKRTSDDPLDEPPAAREEPVYRATFKENVNVTQGGKQLAAAQDLVVDFLNESGESLGGVVGGERGPTTRPRRATTRPTTRAASSATTRPTTGPAAQPIEIRWTGPLTITPLPGDRPERIAPGESIVRLVGSPKRPVEVTRQTETGTGMLKAGMLTHWTIDQGVLLEEGGGTPVEMMDSRGGHIVTRSMRFSERDGTAVLQGKSRALLPVVENADPEKQELMDVAWQERCTLHLAGGGLDDMILSRADLQGKVVVDHPQLKLSSQTLQLLFDEQQQERQPAVTTTTTTQPVQADGKRSTPPLRQLDAAGDVHCVITRPDKTAQTLDCQSLKLLTARTATGQLFARSLVAMGRVHAVDAKQDLRAGYVSVSLAAPTTRPTTRPGAGDVMPGEVESLLAHDNVSVKTVDGKTAEADQLVVEMREGQPSATLHGRPAVVTHDRNKLIADAIQMMSATQQISVPGPGRMEGVQKQEGDRPERPVEVVWEKSMRADGRRNVIEAFGSVVARSAGADGAQNVARGDQVRLTTTRPAKPAATEGDAKDGAAPVAAAKKPTTRPTGDLDVMADHQIQSILLQDGAQVTSVLSEEGGERMFHVTSHSIQYDKAKQKLTIPQEGKLLFADSRPPAKTEAAQAAAGDPFGVRGRTAFEWAESLVYDEAANQVVMTGDVVIARLEHSQSEEDRLRIEADRVIADLEPPAKPTTRPAAAAAAPANDLLAPRMQLKQVRAVGRVLIDSKKLHVRAESLEYDPVKHVLTVRGTQDQPVEQLDENGLPVTAFDELTYNTVTGQMTSKNILIRNRSTSGGGGGGGQGAGRVLPGSR